MFPTNFETLFLFPSLSRSTTREATHIQSYYNGCQVSFYLSKTKNCQNILSSNVVLKVPKVVSFSRETYKIYKWTIMLKHNIWNINFFLEATCLIRY